tara:strand:- start:2786 stop:3856 length:1071 start_codon:yes stop_codon:yes gene_type:complete
MSQGLNLYEQTVSGYGNAEDSIRSYVATYDTDFFRDWTEKHNLAMEKLKSAQDVSGGIGGAYIAGKLAYNSLRGKKTDKDEEDDDEEKESGDGDEEKNTDEHDGDEDGKNDAEDGEEGEAGETENLGAAAPEAVAPEAVAATVADESALIPEGAGSVAIGSSATASGGMSAEGASAFTAQLPSEATLAAPAPSGAAGEAGIGGDFPDAPEPPSAPTFESPTTSGYEAPEDIPDSAPPTGELTDLSAAGDESTTAAGTESTLVTGTSTVEASAAGEAAGGLTLDAVGDAALTVAAGAAEVIPFLGIFASVGIGLYELFHHPHKAPDAPPTTTASSKGEMVLPSYDSVTDTPASSSAF